MPELFFIDISHHQDSVDFAKVKSAGVLGVIHKATEGTGYIDDRYAERELLAREAGLAWASYHFLKHGNVSGQMEHYLSVAEPSDGSRVVIDYEDAACTIDDLIKAVEFLRGELEITVYGASKLTDDARGHGAWLTNTSLWAARYSTSQPVIATDVWPTWTAWQYSDKGQVPGVKGNCDVNTFNGSRENCLKWFGPVGNVAPTPPDDLPLVSIETTGAVRLVVNGKEL